MDDRRLVEAVASAVGLREDSRTASLAAELIRRRPREIASIDLAAAVSALVRRALGAEDFEAALRWIDQARPLGDPRTTRTLDRWRAELLARARRPDEALNAFRALIGPEEPAAGAAMAIDAAETLLDHGHLAQAESLLNTARDLAGSAGRPWIERRAQELLDRLD